jgi:tetratricopeptide (TPR) repeat protein
MLLHVGELDASREHFDAAIAAYDEARTPRSALGSDLGVFTHAWSAHTVFLLGDDAAALERAEQAVSLARRQNHAYSEALALAYAALLHQMRGDVERLLLCAEAAVALCDRHGIGYYGDWALALIGWAKGQSEPAAGIATIESAIEKLDRHRAQARRPYYLSLLADTYGRLGNTERAAAIVDAAIDMATARNDVWWLPALWLQKSEFERLDARDAALRQALALARAQHNRALERRIRARSAGQTVV